MVHTSTELKIDPPTGSGLDPAPGSSVRCAGATNNRRGMGRDDRAVVCSPPTFNQREGSSTVSDGADLTGRIRQVIREHGHLPVELESIDDDTDLFQAGMTSHASVNLMLGLESEFDVEFPDAMLKRSVFQSVSAIQSALARLLMAAA
jgi:acyl carrier protein